MPLFVDPNTGKMQQGKSGAFTTSLEDYNPQAEPTEPTIGETFSGVVTESDAEKQARENRSNILQTSATQEIDEDAIRQRTTDNFQAEIDALEKVFNEKKRVERIAGEGRLGESGAIQARRGLLGSDFGATQTEATRGFNTSKQDAITADKTLALSNIYNKIRASADSEINAKKLAKEAGSSNYLAFIRDTDTRKAGYVSATIKNFISSGNAPTDEDYNNIAGTLGVNVDNVKNAYKEQFDAQEVARQTQEALTKKTELETRETEAGISKTEAEALKLRAEAGDVEAKQILAENKVRTDFEQQAFDNDITLQELQLKRDKYATDTEFKTAQLELDIDKANDNRAKIYNDIENAGKMTPLQQAQLEKLQGEVIASKAKVAKEKINAGKSSDVLDDKIDLIDKILGNTAGIDSVVGSNALARSEVLNPFNVFSSSAQNFIGDVRLLVDKETLDTLIGLKDRGGTLGAISEKELAILQGAATKIAGWEVPPGKDGIRTGKYDISEAKFNDELNRIKGVTQRLKDASKADKEAGVGVGNKTKFDSVDDFLLNSSTIQQESADKLKLEFPDLEEADLIELINEQSNFYRVESDTNSGLPAEVSKAKTGDKEGQCGRFVNKVTGLGVGDTFDSKMAKMDSSITEPKAGMVFTMPYKKTGHCGFIVDVQGDNVIVKDSNWSLDEKVKTHTIPLNQITGLANV